MDQSDRGHHPLVQQVGVERVELGGGEHPLVDDRPARQRREVGQGLSLIVEQLPFDAFAQHERPAFQVETAQSALLVGHEQLPERRHGLARHPTQRRGVGGHLAPAEHAELLGSGDLGDRIDGAGCGFAVRRQKSDPGRVRAGVRELEVDHGPVERVGHLDEDSGPVAGVHVGARGAAVLQMAERTHRLGHQVVRGTAVHVHDERDAAGVVFESRVVQTPRARRVRHASFPCEAISADSSPGRHWPNE